MLKNKDKVPISTCFYHFGELIVPPNTGDPIADKTQKCLVGSFKGKGTMDSLAFRTDYFGVWFGYQIDDYPLVVAHNGDCIQNMGLIGAAGANMSYYLPYYNGPNDLALACNQKMPFNKTLKIWMGNSHFEEEKKCIGLHLYVTGWDVEPCLGNLLDWNLDLSERHPNTYVSGETIKLHKFKNE